MRRIAIKLVVFLLLGAVVNVGVTGALAQFSTKPASSRFALWWGMLSCLYIDGSWADNEEASWAVAWQGRTTRGDCPITVQILVGWPARSFGFEDTYDGDEWVGHARVIPLLPRGFHQPVMPVTPVFPGFLVNTLFYTVMVWALWSTPFAARRLVRRKRGCCTHCGYDLRHAEHEACPECGSAL